MWPLTGGSYAPTPLGPCAGAAALIQRAKDLGVRVSVGSSGAPEKIARNLSLSGLAPLLDPQHIVSAGYVAKVGTSALACACCQRSLRGQGGHKCACMRVRALARVRACVWVLYCRYLCVDDGAESLCCWRWNSAWMMAVAFAVFMMA